MLAKRSNTSPPLIRSPCLAPAHVPTQQRKLEVSRSTIFTIEGIEKQTDDLLLYNAEIFKHK